MNEGIKMNIENWLEYNEYVKIDCPDCGDVWYGEDCPAYCTTCGCTSGQGKMSLRTFVDEVINGN